ncbi:unnamed protein product, partial [Schistosoma bovis]
MRLLHVTNNPVEILNVRFRTRRLDIEAHLVSLFGSQKQRSVRFLPGGFG